MDIKREELLSKICKSSFKWTLASYTVTFLLYVVIGSIMVSLPLIFRGWSSWSRVILLFIGVVFLINGSLPILVDIVKLSKAKRRMLKDTLMDKECVDILNYLLLFGCTVSYKCSGFVVGVDYNTYLNDAPKLDTYVVIWEYDVDDIDLIIEFYCAKNYFIPVYREAIVDFATYVNLSKLLFEADFNEYEFLKKVEVIFNENLID